MNSFIILIRGINVGGRNKVSMDALRKCLEKYGFLEVKTYIASGNIILRSDKSATDIKKLIEQLLVEEFVLDDELIKILVLTRSQLQSVVDNKPSAFGDEPDKYYYDVVFLIDIDTTTAMAVFKPHEGIDRVWPGQNVIYSERLGAERTKSHLNKIIGTPAYKSMTIRTLNTVEKLLELIDQD